MKKEYLKPQLRAACVRFDRFLCLSDVPSVGGVTSDYVEDNENLNG